MAKKSNNFFNLYLRVNDKEATATLNNVGKDLRTLRSYTRNLEEGTEKWQEANKKLAEVEHTYDGMRKKQRELINETKKSIATTEDQTSAMQEFFGSVQETFSSLKNGDFIGAREGFKGIGEGIGLATKAAMKFILTPIGAAIAALAGIAVATRAWFNYNQEALEANKITQQLTQLSGDALDQARVRAQAIEKTFGTDFRESIQSADSLVKAFGISYDEAFDLIENGLARGGQQNGEFLDSIREYPKLFSQAGFTAEEFQRILNTGIDMSIYSDKLPDAIKEFSLSLMEETTASREALENAFGQEFTDRLFRGIQSGSITSKDALQLISAEAKEIGLNAQQAQLLTADLFKSAGEDAGGAQVIFEAVNKALNEEERALTELEQQLSRTAIANRELATAKDEALKSDGFAQLSNDLSIFWTKVQTGFWNIVNTMADALAKGWYHVDKFFSQVGAVFQYFPVAVATAFVKVREELLSLGETFGILGNVIKNTFSFNFDAASEAMTRFRVQFAIQAGQVVKAATSIGDQLKSIYNKVGDEVDARFEASREEARKAMAMQEELAGGEVPSGGTTGTPEEDETDKEAEKRIAKEKAIREKVAATLKEWEEERAIKEELEKFEKDKQAEEREILELENKFAKLEEQANGEKELLARLESEKLQQLQDIREKYAEERREKDLIEKEKLTAQEEKWAAAHEAATIQLEEAKMNAYRMGISNLTSVFDEKTMAFKGMFLFEKGLAAAEVVKSSSQSLAEISAHTAIANAKAVAASPLTGGMPWVAINTATGAKQAATTKINAAMQLANIAATAINGFSEGGDTTPFGLGFRDESGEEVAGIVHTKEYVIPEFVRRDPEVPRIIEYLEDKRVRKLRGYATGGDTTPAGSADPLAPETSFSDPRTNQLLELILEGVTANRDIHFGPEAEMKRQELQKKLENIRSRAKVKKD